MGQRGVSQEIVLVAIDNKSIQSIGRWPWSRSVHAQILDRLTQMEARLVGYDVTFSESSDPTADADFARALQDNGHVVLASEATLRFTSGQEPVATQSLRSLDAFTSKAPSGATTLVNDADGVVRRVPLHFIEQNHQQETFAYKLASALQTIDTDELLDAQGLYRIAYAGPVHAYPTISAADLLNGSVSPEQIRGKLVLVGATAPDLHDLHLTPVGSGELMSGIELQANIVQSLLDQISFQTVSPWLQWLLSLAVAMVFVFVSLSIRLRYALLVSVGALIVYVITLAVLAMNHVLAPVVYPFLLIVGTSAMDLGYRYVRERQQRTWIRQAFDRYLAPQVIDQIIAEGFDLKLGGQKRELTILFSDIRSFTTLSEQLSPQELVTLLNVYLSSMTETVLETQGVVDKYIGDAIMAFWGAPVEQPDHAVRAATTALAMKRTLNRLHDQWAEQQLPLFQIGIGLNTGEVIVGNMGSEKRFDYTVMGDDVNLASRTEGLTKHYGVTILLTEATQQKLGDRFVTRFLDDVIVKGRTQPVKLFELVGTLDEMTTEEKQTLERFAQALDLYRSRQWDQARAQFLTLANQTGDHASELYAERCLTMKAQNPGEDWNGVFVAISK